MSDKDVFEELADEDRKSIRTLWVQLGLPRGKPELAKFVGRQGGECTPDQLTYNELCDAIIKLNSMLRDKLSIEATKASRIGTEGQFRSNESEMHRIIRSRKSSDPVAQNVIEL